MLSLGRFDDLVVDPELFVPADALHERFAVLLMTALFNAGRQSDALAVYERASGAPGGAGRGSSRELRATMEQILRQQGRFPEPPRTKGCSARAGAWFTMT